MHCSKKLFSLFLSLIITLSMFSFPITAKADYSVKGVDVSENNGVVDFYALKNQGFDFAMIRIGYYNYLDKMFYQNVINACNAGMYFGVYLYSYAFNDSEAQTEADFVINTLSALDPVYKAKMTLPVAYDIEDESITNSEKGNCTGADITNHALIFSNTIKANGYSPMLYVNDNWINSYINAQTIADNGIDFWYANWTENDASAICTVGNTGIPCRIWQYSSGDVNSLGVDMNVMYIKEEPAPAPAEPAPVPVNPAPAPVNPAPAPVEPTPVPVTAPVKAEPAKPAKPAKPTITSVKSPKKKELKLSWKKNTKVTGYEVQYSTSSKFKSPKKLTVKKDKTTSTTIKKLKSNKKYYVRVRAYKTVNGEKTYSSWSKAKSIKIK